MPPRRCRPLRSALRRACRRASRRPEAAHRARRARWGGRGGGPARARRRARCPAALRAPRRWLSRAHVQVADDAHRDTFYVERIVVEIQVQGLEIRVGGDELGLVAPQLEPLDGDIVAHAGDDELAVAGLARAMDHDPVAVEDAFVAHAQATDLEEVIRARVEKVRIHRIAAEHVLDGEDRAAGGHGADQGQAALLFYADAAGRAGSELDGAL